MSGPNREDGARLSGPQAGTELSRRNYHASAVLTSTLVSLNIGADNDARPATMASAFVYRVSLLTN
jgi:hypothetical protein